MLTHEEEEFGESRRKICSLLRRPSRKIPDAMLLDFVDLVYPG